MVRLTPYCPSPPPSPPPPSTPSPRPPNWRAKRSRSSSCPATAALAHAASDAVALGRRLEQMGKDVRAVHPVAGRMPGHMHVLLAEAEVDYDKLYEMDAINPRFADTDPGPHRGDMRRGQPQAVETEDTPISGMPILHASQSPRHVVVLNLDDKPGYSGVPSSLYTQPTPSWCWETPSTDLEQLRAARRSPCLLPEPTPSPPPPSAPSPRPPNWRAKRSRSSSCPASSLALAHAASDAVGPGPSFGADGQRRALRRAPGGRPHARAHACCEAEVDYDKLYEMDAINPRFADTDLALIVRACDVVNPQAVETEDTPISGMPILHADQATSRGGAQPR